MKMIGSCVSSAYQSYPSWLQDVLRQEVVMEEHGLRLIQWNLSTKAR